MLARVLSFELAVARSARVASNRRAGAASSATACDAAGLDAPDRTTLDHQARWRMRPGPAAAARPVPDPFAATTPDRDPAHVPATNFRFWRGASGENYVHCAYTLIGCPDLPRSVCLLIRRGAAGSAGEPLAVLRLENAAASLNLARVRQLGATLGAAEVHVHVLGDSPQQRRLIELDLRTGLLGVLTE